MREMEYWIIGSSGLMHRTITPSLQSSTLLGLFERFVEARADVSLELADL